MENSPFWWFTCWGCVKTSKKIESDLGVHRPFSHVLTHNHEMVVSKKIGLDTPIISWNRISHQKNPSRYWASPILGHLQIADFLHHKSRRSGAVFNSTSFSLDAWVWRLRVKKPVLTSGKYHFLWNPLIHHGSHGSNMMFIVEWNDHWK